MLQNSSEMKKMLKKKSLRLFRRKLVKPILLTTFNGENEGRTPNQNLESDQVE